MRRSFQGRLSGVAKDPKLPPLESAPLRSSQRSPLELSLEQIFDEMGKAQISTNSSLRSIDAKVVSLSVTSANLTKVSVASKQDLSDVKKWVGQMLAASAEVASQVATLTIAIRQYSSISVDKKNADLAIEERLDGRLKKIEDNTGAQKLLPAHEGGMPEGLHKIADFIWPIAFRNRAGIIKIVLGWSGFAGFVKLWVYYVTGHHP
jgi:hypothetical protein